MRKNSKTYGKYLWVFLEKGKWLYVPKGFAHGFLALSDETTVLYKCDDLYNPTDESGIIWNDPDLAIDWKKLFDDYNIDAPIVSEKDKNLPLFSNVISY
jgi:dTDP-4-dehydrorhamnose 3,5-epimerase